MTPEDKELLMKDLCARQPYKVKISIDNDTLFIPRLKYIDGLICHFYECAWTRYFDTIKPYLRPMSSITEAEKIELYKIAGFYYFSNDELLKNEWRQFSSAFSENKLLLPYPIWGDDLDKVYDWLNAHHFDYHGLIKKDLALEAPKGMYRKENKL